MNAQQSLADRLALPILLLGAVSISFSGIFVKLSEVGPISTAFFRMALPLPLMAIGLVVAARRFPERKLPRIGPRGWAGIHVAAFFLALDLIVWHWSLQFIGVGISTLLGNTAPIWVALAGFLFFKERFSPRFLVGLALAMAGVVLLVLGGDRSLAVGDWLGLVLATLGAIGYAGYLRGVKAAHECRPSAGDVLDLRLDRALAAAGGPADRRQCRAADAGWLAGGRRPRLRQPDHRPKPDFLGAGAPAGGIFIGQPAPEPGCIRHLCLGHAGRDPGCGPDRRRLGGVVWHFRGPAARGTLGSRRRPGHSSRRAAAETCRSLDLTGRSLSIECRTKAGEIR